ncbi:NAD-dependent epimerase/dehydratase family protein [Chryseobacterium sp. MYb328]|uniref:NAD-dependent epimerase/dehydratase family protein n=1 Tax=Chryseobacterium sp. MYb328 TaxID=2745231 RepID=UPI003094E4AB
MKNTSLNYKDENIFKSAGGLIPTEVYRSILDNVPLICVDLVIVKDNKAFLTKRKNKPCKDVYWMQGGRMLKNEGIEQCGIRKAASELNIPEDRIKITQYLGTFSTEFNDSEQGASSHTVNVTFQAEVDPAVSLGFDNDHSDGKWFDVNGSIPAELDGKYKHHPYIAEVLQLIEPDRVIKTDKIKVLVTGASGFIGSHLGKRLMQEGYYVVGADWKSPEFMQPNEFCHEFLRVDLRTMKNCMDACEGIDWVFNLAADMGGMGFIQSNHSRIGYNNTMISLNMLEAARHHNVQRYFYSSSACVYPLHVQDDSENTVGLKEKDAWPAYPQDIYGLEKLYGEEMALKYSEEFPQLQIRIARFHGIYGEQGTWKGGREKVPAAFCRKAAAAESVFEIWGDGEQKRSFCYIDDCVEGVIRIMKSDYNKPLNLGSEEMISMNDFAKLVMEKANKHLPLKHIEGPEGVRGRNSDNTLIEEVLGWKPSIPLATGIEKTYRWVKEQVEAERQIGVNTSAYSESKVVITEASDIND